MLVGLVGRDAAGGLVQGPGNAKLRIQGLKAVQLGDAIRSHGSGPHQGARMVTASTKLRSAGVPICITGNVASCGDQLVGTSKMNVSA